ncbi:MAG: secondary thiamine-phosphate synthase enzyme YjbQ [Oligoflexales bacterium]
MWQHEIKVRPRRRGLNSITEQVAEAFKQVTSVKEGLLHLFLKHTSASLLINENADPSVQTDLERFLSHMVPETYPYTHRDEGPDDMPAHVKNAFISCSLSIPVQDGKLALGTWQGIFLWEHRDQLPERRIVLTLMYS